jgi:hypothetical protein
LATGVVIVVFVAYSLWEVFHDGANFAAVAVLVLVGLAAFIAIMNVLSVTAHLMGIANKNQPFGLPDGTVRAILTIAFIVLVGVLSSYLLTNSSGRNPFGQEIIMSGIAAKDADATAQRLLADGVVSIERGTGDRVDIHFHPRRDYRLADDVAKQILTMLSTILAAMIGFYFGAQTPPPVAPSGRTGESDERSAIEKDLDGPTGQVQAVRKDVDGKLAAVGQDQAKISQIEGVENELADIERKIRAARDMARDNSVPIEQVRSAHKVANSAVAGLDALKQKLQGM